MSSLWSKFNRYQDLDGPSLLYRYTSIKVDISSKEVRQVCFYAYVTTRTIFIVSSQLIIQNIPESVLVLVRVTPQGISRSKTVFNFVRVMPQGITQPKTILNFVRVTPQGLTRSKSVFDFVRVMPPEK